ncbi:hypothetical protein BDQ17DRAFT_1412945 [Cyathus striatus]|nr:hypothetical protein BDQ17DRAFT_1412945 [Cyathus striatus]
MSSSPSSSAASLLTSDSAFTTQTKKLSVGSYVRAVFTKDSKLQKSEDKDATTPDAQSQSSATIQPSSSTISSTGNSVEWTDSQYVKMAKENGWSAPTATKPSLGGI